MIKILLVSYILLFTSAHDMNNAAFNLMLEGKYIEAEKVFSKLIVTYPKYVTAYNNLGVTYIKLKKYDLAEKAFKVAIKLDKHYSKAYYNLATTLFREKKYSESIKVLKKLYSLDRSYLKKRFKRKKAIKEIKEKLKKDPDNPILLKALNILENN